MKRYILSVILVFAVTCAFAQTSDMVVFRDGTSVEAKVIAVNTDNVEYYRADNINGAKFIIQKNKIAYIVFYNGHKEVFNKVDGGVEENKMPEGNYNGNGNTGGLVFDTSSGRVRTEADKLEDAKRKKKFYCGLVFGGGMSCSDIVGNTEGAEVYYRNLPGLALNIGATFDYYLKESSSWYIGGAVETILEEPRARSSVSDYTITVKMFNKNCLFSVYAGQHFFPQQNLGYGNFYWKAGMAAGFSFLAEGILVVRGNGQSDSQSVGKTEKLGFQLRPIVEAGIGAYRAKVGVRYSPSITPMINVGGTDKSVHNISIVMTAVF